MIWAANSGPLSDRMCSGGPYISRQGVIQDQLVERQVSDCLAQPGIFPLQLFQPVRLADFHAAVLMAPAIASLLRQAKAAANPADRLAPGQAAPWFLEAIR